ncbi:hypothetical protein NP233_g12701 [Leucocoprinus birnbaumii]|uniref:Fungal-type protein kinase domain-containing protein n=1 Tax=Leucocoprinus birnbaumii TaxID=56174 RepID=A0AAD5YPS8_9AGAR|nr:hypothetical protein NP233_g12701 [Leucocoprinus birnbaumii]
MAHLDEFGSAHDVPWVIDGFGTTDYEPDGVADNDHIPPVVGMPPAIGQTLHATKKSSEHRRRHIVQDNDTSEEEEEGDQEDEHFSDLDSIGNATSESTAGDDMEIGQPDDVDENESEVADEDVHQPNPLVSNRASASDGRRRWVAIRSITFQDAKRLWGRGTTVLEVVSLKDWENKNAKAQRYVLKQSWQRLPGLENDGAAVALTNSSQSNSSPELQEEVPMFKQQVSTKPFEAAVLSIAGLEERVAEAGFVKIGGKDVDTATYIRKGTWPDAVDASKSQKRPGKQSQTSIKAQTTTPHTTGQSYSKKNKLKFTGCLGLGRPGPGSATGYSWIVRPDPERTPGFCQSEFANKKELLMGFKGALEEHELCYRHGIIQRDISAGNIIINDGRGHLIDFDHSKITDKLDTLRRESGHQIPQRRRDAWLQDFPANVVDLVEALFQEEADAYLAAKYYTKLGQVDEPSSFADIGWPEELYSIPLFGSCKAGPGYVTGTPPFMSGWLNSHLDHPHTAVQDTEMFPEKQELENLLVHFSPYFEDLKDLIREWWKVLNLAYRFPAGIEYNYPHQAILRCIQQALDRIDASPDSQSDGELQEKVRQQRTTYIKNIQQAILNQKTFDALTKPGTGTATPSTIPVQDAPSAGPTTRSSNPTVPSEQVSRPHKRPKEA